MSAVEFVKSLLERGVGRVTALGQNPSGFQQAVAELDRAARPEMPFDPPDLVESAAAWALEILYHGCQFLAYREVEAETVHQTLSLPCPASPCPGSCYSVDLAMRYLPDLLVLARAIAPADPLVVSLLNVARAWPLSSVGIADLSDLELLSFMDHPSLRQLYVDRIIERQDASRLKDSAVREAVKAALGSFPELAPALAGEVRTLQKTS